MKMTNFQLVVTGIFAALIIVGVGVFAKFGGLGGSGGVGSVVIWGTVDQNIMDQTLTTLRQGDSSFKEVQYVQKPAATYTNDVINAMASGTGPDLVLISQDDLGAFSGKLDTIPYSDVSQATFDNSFVDEGQLFLTPQGSLALPLLIDPLVMYWNRDMFASAGIANPPQYWSDFLTIAPEITTMDASSNITRSAVALGGWDNISNAKAILATLFMQTGDPIISETSTGVPTVAFGTAPQGAAENPDASALQFYTEFVNPSKTTYSWNSSLPQAQDAFAAGDLAVYFDFASNYVALAAQNPNLHFAVAPLPQIQGGDTHITFGQMTGLAIPRTTTNPQGALTIAEKLSGQTAVGLLATATGLPPVRLDVVEDTANSATASVFAQSALIARAWLDPNPTATDSIFQTMVESVVSGESQPETAVQDAVQSFRALLPTTFSQ